MLDRASRIYGLSQNFPSRPNLRPRETRVFIDTSAYHASIISNRRAKILTYGTFDTLFRPTPVFLQNIGLSTPKKPNSPKTPRKYIQPAAKFRPDSPNFDMK